MKHQNKKTKNNENNNCIGFNRNYVFRHCLNTKSKYEILFGFITNREVWQYFIYLRFSSLGVCFNLLKFKKMIVLILLILSAIMKGIMDLSSDDKFLGLWSNKSTGWIYKYKLDEFSVPIKNPDTGKYQERFFGSTTFFVWTTDLWHLSQFMMYRFNDSIFLYLLNLEWYLWPVGFLFIASVRGIVFELVYSKIKT